MEQSKIIDTLETYQSPSIVAWIFLEYYLGVPWESPRLGSCHSLFSSYHHLTQNLKTSITQNLTELREIGQYDKEQTVSLQQRQIQNSQLFTHNSYCSISFPQFILSNIIHRNKETSKLCIENRICQKQNSLQQSKNYEYFCNSKKF